MIRVWLFLFVGLRTCATWAAVALPAAKPPPIKLVGSETVYPYAAAVGERFAKEENLPVPVLESNGTGAGIQLFCRGTGPGTPDILMASRSLTPMDYKLCAKHGVLPEDILEIPIGMDGILLVQSEKGQMSSLSLQVLSEALSPATTPSPKKWNHVSANLPDQPIKILGPSNASGTYESLVTLLLKPFCRKSSSKNCRSLRHDGVYMEMGMNQNMIIDKIANNPDTLGIVTFGFFNQNKNRLRPIALNGIAPTFENLFTRTYPLLRPLYLYLKKPHLSFKPKMGLYIKSFFKEEAISFWGYLIAKGLIPLSSQEKEVVQQRLDALEKIDEQKS